MLALERLGDLNYLAIIVATIAYFAIGAIWYQPFAFGKTWAEKSGIDMSQNPNPMIYVFTVLMYFVMVLAIAYIGPGDAMGGVALGLLTSLGFVVPTLAVNATYQKKAPAVFWIDAAFNVLAFVVAGIIIGAWT